jgi:general L-amino acid transport system permease protein
MANPNEIVFVRRDMVEPEPPPITVAGPLAWMRKNLFSGVFNTLLTLAGIYLVYWLASGVLDFAVFKAVFSGADGEVCRKPGTGACWPYVEAYWPSFVYGRYPIPERWRVDIVYALFALLLLPMAIPSLPWKRWNALALLVAFPIIAFVLLLGGHFGLEPVETTLWGGLLVTLVVAVTGIVASLPIGIVLALGRRSHMPVIRLLSIIYIEFWRGVPLITVLFMASTMLPLFVPAGVDVDKLLRALIGVALFSAAYMAENVRGGLQAIPKGQYEGAMAVGLGYWQMMRLIILPQALKLVIPAIVSTFIALFKDTTLVLIVSIFDLLGQIQSSRVDPVWAAPTTAGTGYLVAALVYFVFCFGMSRYSQFMERRLNRGRKH